MRLLTLLVILSLTACTGPRGRSVEGPVGPAGESVVGPKGDKGEKGDKGDTGDQGPQGEPGKDLTAAPIEKVWISNGSNCSGTYKLPTLAQDFYFIQDGGHTRMLRVSDNGVEKSWPTPSNGPVHKHTLFYKSSNSYFDLEIKEVTLWITRASGCGFVLAQESIIKETE